MSEILQQNKPIEIKEEKTLDCMDGVINKVDRSTEDALTTDIKHSLKPRVDGDHIQPIVNQLFGNLNDDGYQEKLANELISFILESPGCQCKAENLPESGECFDCLSDEEEDNVGDYCNEAFNKYKTTSDIDTVDDDGAPDDVTCSDILRRLKSGIYNNRKGETVIQLTGKLNEDGFPEKLASGIISYILECPNSESEFAKRLLCVLDVMESWNDYGTVMLNAINAVLDAVEPLSELRSLNLYVFTGCCLDLEAFDGKNLRIYENESTSLVDAYAKKLRTRINRNGMRETASESEDDYIEDVADASRGETEEDVSLFGKFVNRFCEILSFLFCGGFRYL